MGSHRKAACPAAGTKAAKNTAGHLLNQHPVWIVNPGSKMVSHRDAVRPEGGKENGWAPTEPTSRLDCKSKTQSGFAKERGVPSSCCRNSKETFGFANRSHVGLEGGDRPRRLARGGARLSQSYEKPVRSEHSGTVIRATTWCCCSEEETLGFTSRFSPARFKPPDGKSGSGKKSIGDGAPTLKRSGGA